MPAIGTGRSCVQCNDAKRRCDRNTPACRLCRRKNLDCVYPLLKPSNFVPITTTEEEYRPSDSDVLDLEDSSVEQLMSEALPDPTSDFVNVTALSLVPDPYAAWFAAPETFLVDHTPMPLPPNFKIRDLES